MKNQKWRYVFLLEFNIPWIPTPSGMKYQQIRFVDQKSVNALSEKEALALMKGKDEGAEKLSLISISNISELPEG